MLESTDNGKVLCRRCPRCGQDIARYRSLAKHIRHGDCGGGDG